MKVPSEFSIIAEQLDQVVLNHQSRRLFHGRGGCYAGLEHVCIDWFEPALVVSLFSDHGRDYEQSLIDWLRKRYGDVVTIYLQQRYQARPRYEHVSGPKLDNLFARRNKLRFNLHLGYQNIGYFLDIEPARLWLEKNALGKKVLNLFSYTCSFSLIATAAGAKSVLNMDLSSNSLNIGRQSYRASGLSLDDVKFFANDILKSWSRLKRYGPYDLVIIDPPSFQKGSFIESKDYEKVLRRMSQLTSPDAKVLCCLNSPKVGPKAFQSRINQYLHAFSCAEHLQASDDFPTKDPSSALKMFVYHKTLSNPVNGAPEAG